MPTIDTLWHYTDAAGLFGIVTGSKLRFGDARFMNDRTERTYGDRLLQAALDEVLAKRRPDLVAEFRTTVNAVVSQPDRLYVCCLSETRESISQWQRYGAGGDGYCIGLDVAGLDQCFRHDQVRRKSMVYDVREQRLLLRKAIDKCYGEFCRLKREERTREVAYFEYVFANYEIDAALLQLKNPYFHDELEWRYVLSLSNDGDPPDGANEEWAARGSYVKPFLALPRSASVPAKLPIVAVVCGPRLEADLAVASVTQFLECRGYAAARVEPSVLAQIWR